MMATSITKQQQQMLHQQHALSNISSTSLSASSVNSLNSSLNSSNSNANNNTNNQQNNVISNNGNNTNNNNVASNNNNNHVVANQGNNNGTETHFWNNLLSDVLFPTSMTDPRFQLECPEDEVWIPSDQTIHWGRRPNYIYPTLKMTRKEDLAAIPRGSRLVAKLWFCDWSWDEDRGTTEDVSKKSVKPDPASTSCFEDEKTMVPFEKNTATFRHLRISKSIKLKKTEMFTINALGFEIGYHNLFTKTPFKSLDIFLSKPVKIHIVAHKGSVKLMQKHGILPVTLSPTSSSRGDGDFLSSPISSEPEPDTPPSPSTSQLSLLGGKRAYASGGSPLDYGEGGKRMKVSGSGPGGEIIEELGLMQAQLDHLKRKVENLITYQSIPKMMPRTIRISCSIDRIKPSSFIYNAFRTRNLELGVTLIRLFNFNVNDRNSNGYTILHVATKHAYPEGVSWCLQNGVAVNAYTNLRCTALHLAYLRNDKQVRKILKEAKADTEVVNVWGLKPRDYRNNRRCIMRPIPEAAHSVEVDLEGFDISFEVRIWFASRINWLEVLKIYIEQLSCDVDVKNPNGQTPLMCACEHRQEEVVRYLLSMGADVNARDIHDSTPLHYAYMSFDQNRAILGMLEASGADPTVKNIFNRTPAWYRNKTLDNHWNPIWNI
eukprot:TRINITY_DN1080_c0_g1_i1.p1 TRINITY_DN1080_c0_g1~~TRINITY_DN1080_c0_g1_i1.p1  ORF type:complete len:659 (-),score=232.83 TRINITY_DN1080_c0_g1_i1:39-2015(-)